MDRPHGLLPSSPRPALRPLPHRPPLPAHFLMGYLLGVPVAGYSLTLGKEHTDFCEAKLQVALGWSGRQGWQGVL